MPDSSGAPLVSIHLGASITSGWYPQAVGIRSGAWMTSGWCPRRLALDRAAYLSQKGKPPPFPRGSMGQSWLLHYSCQYLFGGKDDKWLVPTGCRYSLWSKDDRRFVGVIAKGEPAVAVCMYVCMYVYP